MKSLVDDWFDDPGGDTLTEFVSARTAMDERACETVHQMWLEHEVEEAHNLIVEKGDEVRFTDPWQQISSSGTCFYPGQMPTMRVFEPGRYW